MAEQRKSSVFSWLVAVFILLMVVLIGYSFITGDEADRGPVNAQSIAATSGWISCREEARARLKSPSTADFPWGPDKVIDLGGGYFMVLGHVDAQNSFGAVLRTNFSCKVHVDAAARTYSIEEVNMN